MTTLREAGRYLSFALVCLILGAVFLVAAVLKLAWAPVAFLRDVARGIWSWARRPAMATIPPPPRRYPTMPKPVRPHPCMLSAEILRDAIAEA